ISSSIKVKGTDYLSRFAIVSQLVSRASNINVDWNVRTTGACQSDGSITGVNDDKTGKHHGGANVTILKLGYRFTLDGKIDNPGLVRTTKVAGKCCHVWEHEVSIDIE